MIVSHCVHLICDQLSHWHCSRTADAAVVEPARVCVRLLLRVSHKLRKHESINALVFSEFKPIQPPDDTRVPLCVQVEQQQQSTAMHLAAPSPPGSLGVETVDAVPVHAGEDHDVIQRVKARDLDVDASWQSPAQTIR